MEEDKKVIIKWIDSRQIHGWVLEEDIDDTCCSISSCGFLVRETEDAYTVALSKGYNPLQWCGINVIPKCCVVSIIFPELKESDEKKELEKIDNEEVNGEDYGIDSLFHAQRILEKTLGSVDGYQTDDGILSHKCAITAVKKLYEQKPWSEEDEEMRKNIEARLYTHPEIGISEFMKSCYWVKSLKQKRR